MPSDSLLVFLRYAFGFAFVAFVPGYCLINVLFIARNKLDFVEQLVLSVALSFGLDGLIGLFLGLSPIGLSFTSITISIGMVVFVFAIAAFIRKSRELNVQSPQQVST